MQNIFRELFKRRGRKVIEIDAYYRSLMIYNRYEHFYYRSYQFYNRSQVVYSQKRTI